MSEALACSYPLPRLANQSGSSTDDEEFDDTPLTKADIPKLLKQ